MDVNNNKLIVNIILTDKDLKRFYDLKQIIGIEKPNTEIIRRCIFTAHKYIIDV